MEAISLLTHHGEGAAWADVQTPCVPSLGTERAQPSKSGAPAETPVLDAHLIDALARGRVG